MGVQAWLGKQQDGRHMRLSVQAWDWKNDVTTVRKEDRCLGPTQDLAQARPGSRM